MERLSPFSIHHDWHFEPTLLPDDIKVGHAPIRAGQEVTALKAIGSIGVIGSVQISRLFGFKRHHIRRMLAEKKLVQHVLTKNNNVIPVFTIGPRAASLLHLPFELNKWRTWSIDQILQQLVFFQFGCALNDKQKIFQIHGSTYPFTGKIQIDGDVRHILVIRRPVEKLSEALRHHSAPIIYIAESLAALEQVQPGQNAKLLLDEDLRGDYRFYMRQDGRWVR